MKRWKRWLFGSVTALVTGAQPEDFLNLCAQWSFPLDRMERVDDFTLLVEVTPRQYPALCRLAQRAQCQTQRQKGEGLPFFFLRFRRRYAFIIGAALCLLLLLGGSRTILTMDISGNSAVTDREILSQLRLCGVKIGTYGPSVPIRAVENKMMLAMDELKFFALNLHGTRAEIIVRERDPVPALRQEKIPADVVSAATGIVTHIEPWNGDACFREGDTVCRGDILISGVMELDPPPMVEADLGTMVVHAEGKVLARTWHTCRAQISLAAEKKVYTGEEITRCSLTAQGRRMKFYQNGGVPNGNYDIITRFKSWSPGLGGALPLVWEKETLRAYTLAPVRLDRANAEVLLRDKLRQSLEESMDRGKILKADYRAEQQGDILTVTLLAECSEQIGRTRVMSPARLLAGPSASAGESRETTTQRSMVHDRTDSQH